MVLMGSWKWQSEHRRLLSVIKDAALGFVSHVSSMLICIQCEPNRYMRINVQCCVSG